MAVLLAFIGLLGNPVLLFVALFVWIGASQASTHVPMKAALAGVPVRHAMLTHYRSLTRTSTLSDARTLLLTGSQQDFPVVEDGRVAGMLTRADLVAAIERHEQDTAVETVMQHQVDVADAGDMLESALVRLKACRCQTLPVTSRGLLVGLVTVENVGEFLMIQAAERKAVASSRSSS
jgi:predicted transcriptional regulator